MSQTCRLSLRFGLSVSVIFVLSIPQYLEPDGREDKEVQGYYEDGMRVPDDVTLLWSDDKYVISMLYGRDF